MLPYLLSPISMSHWRQSLKFYVVVLQRTTVIQCLTHVLHDYFCYFCLGACFLRTSICSFVRAARVFFTMRACVRAFICLLSFHSCSLLYSRIFVAIFCITTSRPHQPQPSIHLRNLPTYQLTGSFY